MRRTSSFIKPIGISRYIKSHLPLIQCALQILRPEERRNKRTHLFVTPIKASVGIDIFTRIQNSVEVQVFFGTVVTDRPAFITEEQMIDVRVCVINIRCRHTHDIQKSVIISVFCAIKYAIAIRVFISIQNTVAVQIFTAIKNAVEVRVLPWVQSSVAVHVFTSIQLTIAIDVKFLNGTKLCQQPFYISSKAPTPASLCVNEVQLVRKCCRRWIRSKEVLRTAVIIINDWKPCR